MFHSRAREILGVVLAQRLYFVGIDRMPRNFEPMRKQVEVWQRSELTDVTANVAIYFSGQSLVVQRLGGAKNRGAQRDYL
jgi:hypothetical protein